jgi:capsular exopolysaccharide synthesis family protein
MSRIFEALQKSPGGKASGFSDFASALRETPQFEAEAPVASPVDLEQFPALAVTVPRDSRIFCLTDKDSLGSEKFRFLGVRLRQLQQSQGLKKILVTSTIPEEGKSTISANLAATLARKPQHRVLLLDGDLRRPSLSRLLGLRNLKGLSEWLRAEPDARETIYRLDGPGFWFLPAGAPADNPLDLMQSARFVALMERLAGWFDWIVIDTPPVLPLADTSVWAKSTDGILLVAREGTTRKRQLQRGLAALDTKKLIGVVLNNSRNTDHTDYYQRYGSGVKKVPDPI